MRRAIQIPIALWVLGALFISLCVPGLAVFQPLSRGTVCQGQEPATPQVPGTSAATPQMPDVGPAGVFQSDASRIELEHGGALLWRSGERGVLLLHGAAYDAASWEDQARALASQGFTVLAMEELVPDAVRDGLAYLMETCGASGVTVIGASAGGAPALEVLSEDPTGISGLILLGATSDVSALGEYPKLFVASEGEGLTDRLMAMAGEASGNSNETLILPGSAHAQAIFESGQGDALVDAILVFLTETAVWGEYGVAAGRSVGPDRFDRRSSDAKDEGRPNRRVRGNRGSGPFVLTQGGARAPGDHGGSPLRMYATSLKDSRLLWVGGVVVPCDLRDLRNRCPHSGGSRS